MYILIKRVAALPNECEALLSDGSDLVAEKMRFELGWNSTSTTITISNLAFGYIVICISARSCHFDKNVAVPKFLLFPEKRLGTITVTFVT